MDGKIRVCMHSSRRTWRPPEVYTVESARKVLDYHRSFPQYRETELIHLRELSEPLGVDDLILKDESTRFGLQSFKILGGSYAVGRVLAERSGIPAEKMSYRALQSDVVKNISRNTSFITATDGNHGRGVAFSCREFGSSCTVYLPQGSAAERTENIQKAGARTVVTDLLYDDAVRKAASDAENTGAVLMQDTAWPGYEKYPEWIMRGYLTMFLEIYEQLKGEVPTHIFLQAGVGSMAAAGTAFFRNCWQGNDAPEIIIVEPNAAPCCYLTAAASDGKLHRAEGELNTVMAGLACGIPSTIAWKILDQSADAFVTIPEWCAEDAVRRLHVPEGRDRQMDAGESGAAGFGLAYALLAHEELAEVRASLGLGRKARILCIITEGVTDHVSWNRIIGEEQGKE